MKTPMKPRTQRKKALGCRFCSPTAEGVFSFHIFLLDAGSAFECYLDVVIPHDDPFNECLHEHGVVA